MMNEIELIDYQCLVSFKNLLNVYFFQKRFYTEGVLYLLFAIQYLAKPK